MSCGNCGRDDHNARTCTLGTGQDYFCWYCGREWRVEGNGGLVNGGRWPVCVCGTGAQVRSPA